MIDISRLPELHSVSEDAAAVSIGACVTHAAIEDGQVADPSRGLMPKAAAGLAYRAIRSRGIDRRQLGAVLPRRRMARCADGVGCRGNGLRGWAGSGVDQMRRIWLTGVFETVLSADEIIRKGSHSKAFGGWPMGLSESCVGKREEFCQPRWRSP